MDLQKKYKLSKKDLDALLDCNITINNQTKPAKFFLDANDPEVYRQIDENYKRIHKSPFKKLISDFLFILGISI